MSSPLQKIQHLYASRLRILTGSLSLLEHMNDTMTTSTTKEGREERKKIIRYLRSSLTDCVKSEWTAQRESLIAGGEKLKPKTHGR